MARTGQPRKTKQPLKIDRLPPSVHDAIKFLRNERGLVWEELEARSAQKYSPDWKTDGGGFIDWDNLPTHILELFPDITLGHSLLHRWWDIRVEQVNASVMVMSTQARSIAKVFAKAAKASDKETIQSAARDILLGILAEDSSVRGRKGVAGGLIKLGELMQLDTANKIKERKVAVDERKVAELEREAEARRNKMDAETAKLSKKAAKGEITEEDLNRLRERVFGLPPKPRASEAVA